ncbi:hypothetical protein OAF82_00565 [bacterium]|nr:hypothetical protein [bacterium]
MDNERQQSHRGRWIMLYVMLGFVGLSIFSLADAIKSPDPVVVEWTEVGTKKVGVLMSDGSTWIYKTKDEDGEVIGSDRLWMRETIMVNPPAR